MKGHTSAPDDKNIEGVFQIKSKIVEYHVTEARSHDKTQNEIEEEIVNNRPVNLEGLFL